MGKTKFLLGACVVASIAAASYAYQTLGTTSSAKSEQISHYKLAAPKVLIAPVQSDRNARQFETTSTAWADKSAEIYPNVEEEVVSVNFKAQQKVKRGQILVQQDDREEQLALQLAQVQLKNAQSLLERYKQAVSKGAVPQSQVDTAQADYDAAVVAVEQAKLAIEYRKIRAPFDGVVGIPDVDPGQRIGPSFMVTGVDSRELMYLDFEVPESLVGGLSNVPMSDIAIQATTPALPGREFKGQVVALNSRLNQDRRTLLLRAHISNKDDALRPGMSFVVRVSVAGETLAAVPEIALQWDRAGSYVWLVRDGKADREDVQVVDRRNGLVFIDGALKAGEAVVVEGVLRLSEGTVVQVVEDPL
ncbi:MAG TPA: efflux RND transporter periplasmic adaptor subunit [Limnobacter sp.]|nr:efflux RND transporter periplasmic adaptor subunit [Limnobacter sp.]